MNPASVNQQFERLVAANIQLLPAEIARHFVFERDGFIALVERDAEGGFGRVGTPGRLTDSGFAPVMWRGNEAFFVAKGYEAAATSAEIEQIRSFARDLAHALVP